MTEFAQSPDVERESSFMSAWAGIFEGFVGIHQKTGLPYCDIRPEIRHGHRVYRYRPTAHSIQGSGPGLVVIDIFPRDSKDPYRSLVAFAVWDRGKAQIQHTMPADLDDAFILNQVSQYMGKAAEHFDPNAH